MDYIFSIYQIAHRYVECNLGVFYFLKCKTQFLPYTSYFLSDSLFFIAKISRQIRKKFDLPISGLTIRLLEF